MFAFLVSVEIEIRKHLTMFHYGADNKESAIQKIIQYENVWDMASFNWDIAEANELLKTIVQQYFRVHKKTTQKSKGLRKTPDS